MIDLSSPEHLLILKEQELNRLRHAYEIALIEIKDLRKKLEIKERGTDGFGSTGKE